MHVFVCAVAKCSKINVIVEYFPVEICMDVKALREKLIYSFEMKHLVKITQRRAVISVRSQLLSISQSLHYDETYMK